MRIRIIISKNKFKHYKKYKTVKKTYQNRKKSNIDYQNNTTQNHCKKSTPVKKIKLKKKTTLYSHQNIQHNCPKPMILKIEPNHLSLIILMNSNTVK